jgi:hypothetical protein
MYKPTELFVITDFWFKSDLEIYSSTQGYVTVTPDFSGTTLQRVSPDRDHNILKAVYYSLKRATEICNRINEERHQHYGTPTGYYFIVPLASIDQTIQDVMQKICRSSDTFLHIKNNLEL